MRGLGSVNSHQRKNLPFYMPCAPRLMGKQKSNFATRPTDKTAVYGNGTNTEAAMNKHHALCTAVGISTLYSMFWYSAEL